MWDSSNATSTKHTKLQYFCNNHFMIYHPFRTPNFITYWLRDTIVHLNSLRSMIIACIYTLGRWSGRPTTTTTMIWRWWDRKRTNRKGYRGTRHTLVSSSMYWPPFNKIETLGSTLNLVAISEYLARVDGVWFTDPADAKFHDYFVIPLTKGVK